MSLKVRINLTSFINFHRHDTNLAIGQDVLQQVGVAEKDFAIFEQLQMSAHSVLWHCRR
jgi:hypothetical protein